MAEKGKNQKQKHTSHKETKKIKKPLRKKAISTTTTPRGRKKENSLGGPQGRPVRETRIN